MQTGAIEGDRVVLTGRLDATTAGQVRAVLHAAVLDGVGELTVDMSEVEALDAVGLGVLMGSHRLAEAGGRALVLTRCPPRVAPLLRAIRLHRGLRVGEGPARA